MDASKTVKLDCYSLINIFADASSSNEAVHLQQRLQSLSTELLTLRNRLHVQGSTTPTPTTLKTSPPPPTASQLPIQSRLATPLFSSIPELRDPVPNVGCDLEDLIHLQGPLTEDAVMKCLHARFGVSNFYVSIIITSDVYILQFRK